MLKRHCIVHCIVKLYTIMWLLSDILGMVWKYLFMLFIPGHRTFPRSSMMNRRPELNSTFRSFMSRGSEGTLSTSSSSSGYPPDPEDSPDGRMFKRSSAEGSPSFNPAFSKCKYKYTFPWFIQEGLLSVTSESMCMNYWLTTCSSLPSKKCG